MKQFSGLVTMTRVLEASEALRAGRIAAKEAERLAASGIRPELAIRIADQFSEFGETVDGVRLANTGRWTDREAVTAFRAAVVKEVDRIIVTPGQDKPLWMSTEWGRVIGQFKSFQVASVQRTLLTGLQQRDMAALNGAAMMVGLGMLVYAAKTKQADRETSDDWRVWVAEGVDRSGLTGWIFDANNIVEKASRGNVGVNAIIGGPTMSRYASRNLTGSLLGPTAGTVQTAAAVTGALSTGEFNRQDVRAFRRLLPYQNVFYMRRLFDAAESGVASNLGVPEK